MLVRLYFLYGDLEKQVYLYFSKKRNEFIYLEFYYKK